MQNCFDYLRKNRNCSGCYQSSPKQSIVQFIQNSQQIQKWSICLILDGMPMDWGWGGGESEVKREFPNCFTENFISMNTPRTTLITQQVLDKCMLIN